MPQCEFDDKDLTHTTVDRNVNLTTKTWYPMQAITIPHTLHYIIKYIRRQRHDIRWDSISGCVLLLHVFDIHIGFKYYARPSYYIQSGRTLWKSCERDMI